MSEHIKMHGRLLLFDVIHRVNFIHMFPKDCEITYPEKVPFVYDFEFNNPDRVLGYATITKDEKGLICDAVINNVIDRDILRETFNNELPIGGFYNKTSHHQEEHIRVFDRLNLVAIGVTLGPVHEDYKLVLSEEEE